MILMYEHCTARRKVRLTPTYTLRVAETDPLHVGKRESR